MNPAIQAVSDDEARKTLEAMRWPNDVATCPKCGIVGESFRLKRLPGSSSRPGLWKCRECRRTFTATMGTIFEDSHIKLGTWFTALHLLAASKKGMSAHQLHRMLGITYKSAWFMAHRLRFAMSSPPLVDKLRGIVEADETFVGGVPENMHAHKRTPAPPKTPVLSLVERGGNVRSEVVPDVTGKTLRAAIRKHVDTSATLMTDGHKSYSGLRKEFAGHESVNHEAKEYVRGNVHTNTAEGYFSILKRGIIGTYHHVSVKHLPRYLAEFDQRYNTRASRGVNDTARAALALKGTIGKRLTYKPLVKRAEA